MDPDFSGVPRLDSIPSAVLFSMSVVVPVSDSIFLEMFRVPLYTSSPRHIPLRESGCFCTKPTIFSSESVHGYKIPTTKATRVHGASLFFLQRSLQVIITANASLVRNRGPQRKKRRKKVLYAANAFWSLWVRNSGRSRGETQRGSCWQRRKPSHYQSQNPGKGKPIQWVREESSNPLQQCQTAWVE